MTALLLPPHLRRALAVGAANALIASAVASTAPAQGAPGNGAPLPAPARFDVPDMVKLVRIADPRLSPDGAAVVAVVARADTTTNRWKSELLLIDVVTGAQHQLTRERRGVASPRWSPSGDRLALLAVVKTGEHDVPQLYVLPMRGGDARRITSVAAGVQQFAWRPDGREIAFVAADAPDSAKLAKGNDAFEVGNNDYLTTEAPTAAHLWLVSADSGAARRLTSGSWSLPISFPPGPPSSPISWSPDGRRIAFARQERPYPGETELTTAQVLDVATGQIRALTAQSMLEGFPQYSPDGERIAYLFGRDGDIVNVTDVYVAPPGGGIGQNLTRGIDRQFYRALWLPDGRSLITGANDLDRVSLWQVWLDGKSRRLELGSLSPSNGFWLDADVGRSGALVFTGSEAKRPTELYYMASPTAAVRRLTDFNGSVASMALGNVETVEWQGPDGFRENGIVVYPPTFTPTRKYPVVLVIHGGPNAASLQTFSPVAQALATHGYIVFSPNYRGSDNFGNAYYRAVIKNAGDGPGRDVMAGLAVLKRRAYVDSTRIAVSGWSYGGFMTTWLIGHYTGWKAAVAGAAVTDLADQYNFGDGNVGWRYFVGGTPWSDEGERLYRAQSPITNVGRITTPTLVMSNTGDVRVPATQSYKLYRALRDRGIETRFIAYPVGGHFPADPIRSRDVYRRWVEWIDQHMTPTAATLPDG